MAKKNGRPTKAHDAYFIAACAFYEIGYTDKQVAEKLKIDEKTIHNWKKINPEFFQSIKDSKEKADKEVEQSLFKRAKGFNRLVQKINKDGDIFDLEEELPPDPTSCIFWLKNRQPDKWREKQQVEHSGQVSIPDLVTKVLPKSND